ITRDFERRIAACNGTVDFLEKQLKPKGTYVEANRLRDQAELKLKAENAKLREDLETCTGNMKYLEQTFTEAGDYADRLRAEKIAIEEKYKLLERLHREKLENTAATLGGYNKSSQGMKDSIQELKDRTLKLTETIRKQGELLNVNSFSTKISAISDRHQQEISDLTDNFVKKNEECEERFNRKNDLLHESDNLLSACNTNYRVCKADLTHLQLENEKLEALYNSIGQRHEILASQFEDVTRRFEDYKTEMQQSIPSDSIKGKDRGMPKDLSAEVSALTEENTTLDFTTFNNTQQKAADGRNTTFFNEVEELPLSKYWNDELTEGTKSAIWQYLQTLNILGMTITSIPSDMLSMVEGVAA
ncbi:MAG: hypothetical protein EBU33_10415, partial [Sphingobacteriia bacterium]|nr:hypothetical protein [Sphingobacteriia bacterium]